MLQVARNPTLVAYSRALEGGLENGPEWILLEGAELSHISHSNLLHSAREQIQFTFLNYQSCPILFPELQKYSFYPLEF
jgi:hypothetical protein